MRILFKLPSKGRGEILLNLLYKYYDFIDNKNDFTFIITLDLDDDTTNNDEFKNKLNCFNNLIYFFDISYSKIDAINRDFDKINIDDYDIIVVLSDDMHPVVKGFDNIIRDNYEKYYPDFSGVLFFNDGFRKRDINTLPILGVKYYKIFNYIYHNTYKSFYCDNEFTIVADMLNKQTYFEEVIIKHLHPDNYGGEYDSLYIKNHQYYVYDYHNFCNRKKINFGI